MHHGVKLALGLPKFVHLPYFRHVSLMTKYIWLGTTDYFYIIVLFPLTSILQLINLQRHNFSVY